MGSPSSKNYPHIIEHGLQGFIVKNIEGESTEANDLSRTYFVKVGLLHEEHGAFLTNIQTSSR